MYFPEDKLESVFDSFSQGSTGINRKYDETGLGLTIVKKLVAILGGKIKLYRIVNQRSSFIFKQPCKASKKLIVIDDSNLIGKKIVVVEDNKINPMITKKMLKNKAINCEIVDSGEESVKISKNYKFNMIRMDIHLPGMN